jgi:hypothetical protein
MNTAANALVKSANAANPLVVTGGKQKNFRDIVCYESEETLLAARQELEASIEKELAAGTSRFSDLVQNMKTRLAILNANLGF